MLSRHNDNEREIDIFQPYNIAWNKFTGEKKKKKVTIVLTSGLVPIVPKGANFSSVFV